MAKPIRHIEYATPTEAEKQAESLTEILQAISESREAILIFLDILRDMQTSGALDIIQGMLKNREELGSLGIKFINVANLPIMMKNLIIASQFLGKMDPIQTERIFKGLQHGLEQAANPEDRHTTGIWGLAKSLRDPEINSALVAGLDFLRGMSRELHKEREHIKREANEHVYQDPLKQKSAH
ncbi:helical membrane plugin domain-containing protein [Aneurinibacillus sp. REN35]|uniref:DUF1641 domain-containing protein n=1 Tax=Aneurinibacillus sp. REN35 TaxID=3237286 RepID=UPI00352870CE